MDSTPARLRSRMKIAGVIIAGGRSSRMGGTDKTLAEIGGKSILNHIIGRLAPQVGEVAINANGDAQRFAEAGRVVFPDALRDVGTPLAGLHAALGWAKDNEFDAVVTVPSDAPFLPSDLVRRLAEQRPVAAIAASGGQQHYVTGLWTVSCLPELEAAVQRDGLFRVKDWARFAKAICVEWQATPFDPFFNVNTPEDLAEAQRIAAEFQP